MSAKDAVGCFKESVSNFDLTASGKSYGKEKRLRARRRRLNVILAVVRHCTEAVPQDMFAGGMRTSLGLRRHTALSPTIRSVYLGNVLKYHLGGALGRSHLQSNVGVGSRKGPGLLHV